MKREYLLFIILCIIIVLAIVYFYLDKKTSNDVEGFDVKSNPTLKTPGPFVDPTVSSIRPRTITGNRVATGYYRLNDNQEMLLPVDYATISTPPDSKYTFDLPAGYYIALNGENPCVAKLPNDYDRVTLPPYKMISNQGLAIPLNPKGNYTIVTDNAIDLVGDTNNNKTVSTGYYRLNDNKQMRLPNNSLELTPAPDEAYRLSLPSGYIIAKLGDTEYVTKAANGIQIPAGYYVTLQGNQNVLAKLPDYSVVLSLLPKVDDGYTMPEGYYIANKDPIDVLAKLPNKDEVLTLPPKSETPPKLLKGYYIARYSKVEIAGGTRTAEIEYLAKLPNGYTIPYESNTPDEYGRYTVKSESKTYTIGTGNNATTITVTYDAYRPKPNTYATIQSELYRLSIDENDYFGKVIVDEVYGKNYDKTNYDANTYTQYHDTPDQILNRVATSANAGSSPSFGSMTVVGPDGKMVEVPYVNGQALPTYYQPGSYTYGTTYVPNYEDSVYLSKSTGLSTLGKMYPTASVMGGFCNSKMSMEELEKKCNAVPNDQCASMSCCVLLGGSKCVYGNELGPKLKANYSDTFIKNRDVYYYQGKCYGNCV
jgi:hypothetical protein